MLNALRIKLNQLYFKDTQFLFQGYAVCQLDDQAHFQRVAGGQSV